MASNQFPELIALSGRVSGEFVSGEGQGRMKARGEGMLRMASK
jgi:hypothetical protein